jgi:hypothetical protein
MSSIFIPPILMLQQRVMVIVFISPVKWLWGHCPMFYYLIIFVITAHQFLNNVMSIILLPSQTYMYVQIDQPEGSIADERSGGLYTLPLHYFLSLGSPFTSNLLNIGSTTPDTDVLDLWHRRLADTSH